MSAPTSTEAVAGAELAGSELWVFNTLADLSDGKQADVTFDQLVAAKEAPSPRTIKGALESLQQRRYVSSRKVFGLGTNGDLLLANRRVDDEAREHELAAAAEAGA